MEYFYDHVRIERMLFDAVPPVVAGLAPDLARPGIEFDLNEAAARPYRKEIPMTAQRSTADHDRPPSAPGGHRPPPRVADGEVVRRSLAVELLNTVEGEVRFDAGSRALYATDASNYRQVPVGVVLPRNVDDVVATVAACRRFGVPMVSRGGGTSLAGQGCNAAVVIDHSKYLNEILEIDPERAACPGPAGHHPRHAPGCRREARSHVRAATRPPTTTAPSAECSATTAAASTP